MLTLISSGTIQTINNSISDVTFKIGNLSFSSVKGKFKGMKGNISFDPKDLVNSSFDVCIDASSINTANEKRDKHLRSEDFLDTEKYPTICFASSEVKRTTSGYETTGNLTLHGVTKGAIIPFQFKNNLFTGQLKINRFDYNIAPETGTIMAGKEINITIKCAIN